MARTVRLTKGDAEEVRHKLGVLAETGDLLLEYGLSEEQINELSATVAEGEWRVPDEVWGVVSSEMRDHVTVLYDIASDARSGGKPGQAAAITKQANRLGSTFAIQTSRT